MQTAHRWGAFFCGQFEFAGDHVVSVIWMFFLPLSLVLLLLLLLWLAG
jgi:hypothetical protein